MVSSFIADEAFHSFWFTIDRGDDDACPQPYRPVGVCAGFFNHPDVGFVDDIRSGAVRD